MVIELGFVYSLIMVVIFFLGLLLACKVTSLNASPAGLALVTVITSILSLIPSVGGAIALVGQYFVLKKIDPHGSVLLTMLINIITTFIVLFIFLKVMNNVSISF